MCHWISLLADATRVLWAPQINSHTRIAEVFAVSEDSYCKVEWTLQYGVTYEENGAGPQGEGPLRRVEEFLTIWGMNPKGGIANLSRFAAFLRGHGQGANLKDANLRG